jgi:hypothetical protein
MGIQFSSARDAYGLEFALQNIAWVLATDRWNNRRCYGVCTSVAVFEPDHRRHLFAC